MSPQMPSISSPLMSALSPSCGTGQQGSPPAFSEGSLPSPHLTLSAGPIPPSRYPIAADSYHPHYTNASQPVPYPRPLDQGCSPILPLANKAEDVHQYPIPPDNLSTYPLYNWSYKQHQALPPHPPPLPPLSYYYRPHRLEDVAPRDTISLIIALFFDFVYPLTPCIHKPSFMADLHSRREERDPLFFALVMSTLACTLVQMPRSYLPMERMAVRKLAQVRARRHLSFGCF